MLANLKKAPLDTDLYYFVELQRFTEQIATSFGYILPYGSQLNLTVGSVQILVNTFKSRLDDLRSSVPSDSRCMSKNRPDGHGM